MADAGPLQRLGPLADRRSVSILPVGAEIRFSFRGSEAAAMRVGTAFGVTPGADVCRAVTAGARTAVWLGPDEWLLLAGDSDANALHRSLEQALETEPHSLVDISHRNVGFDVVGTAAPEVLSEGCPLDFDINAFPIGMCTRTVMGKAEVMVWRVDANHFRLECWRSFAPYLAGFLTQAAENQD